MTALSRAQIKLLMSNMLASGSMTDKNVDDVLDSIMGPNDAASASYNALRAWLLNAVVQGPGLAIDTVPEKFKTVATTIWRRAGLSFSKDAETALEFSDAHVVAANCYGVVLVQVDDEGVVTTKVPDDPQEYATLALAQAALPEADEGNTAIACIEITAQQDTVVDEEPVLGEDWVANTSDLTDESDLLAATFHDLVTAVPGAIT